MVTQEKVNEYINGLIKQNIHGLDEIRDRVSSNFDIISIGEVHKLVEKWASEDQSY